MRGSALSAPARQRPALSVTEGGESEDDIVYPGIINLLEAHAFCPSLPPPSLK